MNTPTRRALLAGAMTAAFATAAFSGAHAADTPGVTATEIRIGATASLSGPVSALGTQTRTQEAFFRMINDRGGIAGRKINFIFYDDGFSPPRTVEQTRRLLESDQVAFLFSNIGTAPNSAIVKYVNARKVPHLFITVNGDKWGDHKAHPWTMGFPPSGRAEARIFTRDALKRHPDGKIAVLYQNDDYGKDYLAGVRDVLGDDFDKKTVIAPYEVADATVDSQIINLRQSGAASLISGATAKFAAQAIRKLHDINWKPTHYISNGSASIAGVLLPAGVEASKDVIATAYLKDPTDPEWADDAAVKDYLAFMKQYYPAANLQDAFNTYAYTVSQVLMKVLAQCNGDFSRENIMKQATSLDGVAIPMLLPGITVRTSPGDYHPIEQLQLQSFDGKGWKRFGAIIDGSEK